MSSAARAVTARPVTFSSGNTPIAGTLFWPSRLPAAVPQPAVLVTGSITTVKEQMATTYAMRVAEAGFPSLVFDFRGWGESGGDVRHLESPAAKSADVAAAARYLQTVDGIDPNRIGALALCASVGPVAQAIAKGAPVRALVGVASWLHDAETVGAVYGGDAGVQARQTRASDAAAVDTEPAYAPDDPLAALPAAFDYYADRDRGGVPAWTNRFAVASWPEWLAFDGVSSANGVGVPTLLIHSDDALLPANVRRFHAALGGRRHLLWTEGAHSDFYDREPQVSRAVDAAVAHFRDVLGVPERRRVQPNPAQAIASVVTQLLWAIDTLDWASVAETLAADVYTDYTSLFGGLPVAQSREGLLGTWRAMLPGFDATQHLTGPVLVEIEGERANARCAVTAVHRLGEALWTVGGHYLLGLTRSDDERWRIQSIVLHTAYVQGDRTLPQRAGERVARATPAT